MKRIDEAVRFLKDALANGSQPASQVEAEARARGISLMTLRRARQVLGIQSKKVGGRRGRQFWLWSLPVEGVHPDDHLQSAEEPIERLARIWNEYQAQVEGGVMLGGD